LEYKNNGEEGKEETVCEKVKITKQKSSRCSPKYLVQTYYVTRFSLVLNAENQVSFAPVVT